MKDKKKLDILLSSQKVVLENSLLLFQCFGILLFKILQQKRSENARCNNIQEQSTSNMQMCKVKGSLKIMCKNISS